MEKFQTFSITVNKSFLPNSQGKKIIWSKLIQIFLKIRFRKRTHVFDNTMISWRKTFQKKDSVKVIKTQNHTTWQNSWSYVTIRELQARKHNQFSATKRLLRKDKIQKTWTFLISKSRYLSFLETKIRFKTLNLWKTKGHEISRKIVKKEVTGH